MGRFTLRLPDDMQESLEAKAIEDGKSLNQLVVEACGVMLNPEVVSSRAEPQYKSIQGLFDYTSNQMILFEAGYAPEKFRADVDYSQLSNHQLQDRHWMKKLFAIEADTPTRSKPKLW